MSRNFCSKRRKKLCNFIVSYFVEVPSVWRLGRSSVNRVQVTRTISVPSIFVNISVGSAIRPVWRHVHTIATVIPTTRRYLFLTRYRRSKEAQIKTDASNRRAQGIRGHLARVRIGTSPRRGSSVALSVCVHTRNTSAGT